MASPVITAFSPTPGAAPGSVGGMPSAFADATRTPIVLTVTDADGAGDLALLQISALFLDGSAEVIYRAGGFATGYVAGSARTGITNGYQFSIGRGAGWPGGDRAGAPAIGIAVDVADAAGHLTTATFFYPMPAVSSLVTAAAVVADGAIDLFGVTQQLIVTQLRA